MVTYQDFLSSKTNEENVKSFIYKAINEYKTSSNYNWAVEGDKYARQLNTTIMKYQKLLYTMSGKAVPDNYTANHKLASNFFDRFVTQETQYLLGNGVTFNDKDTKEKLGGSQFDYEIQKAGKNALIQGVSFVFFNFNHIEVFKADEFVPLWDEEDGALKAGIRFWQISTDKPLRATLYELDGKTEYIKRKDQKLEVLQEKTPYIQIVKTSVADGVEIYNGENYPNFPIIPLWGNSYHQSELVGIKSEIDAYDLIRSGFANDVDDASLIYWTLENCGGMDDIDMAKFIERMKTVHAASIDGDGNARAEAHTIDLPTNAREVALDRLEKDLYNDFMALNLSKLTSGGIAVTATAIVAAYEPLNQKADSFEYEVNKCIKGILDLIGVDDEPTFKRNQIANESEQTAMIISCADYLDTETILKHLPFLNVDEVESIIKRKKKEQNSSNNEE